MFVKCFNESLTFVLIGVAPPAAMVDIEAKDDLESDLEGVDRALASRYEDLLG